jgi:hypothetical protein
MSLADDKRSTATPQVSSARSGSVPMSMPLPRRQASLRNNLLDPQLGPKIKTEPNSRPSTPGLTPSYDTLEGHRSYTAPMHGWGSMPYGPSPSTNSYASDADDDDDDGSSYGYAPTRMPRRRKMSDETNSWQGSMSGSLNGSVYISEEQDPMDVPSDMARLKGEIWPGMDIFDSATPEMRRKRNQKKATSVIVQLQATSEIVTPTELIFDNLGQFKKERIISGEPNSADSPLRGETTPEPDEPPAKKKTTRRRPRAALADRDPNAGRNLRSNRRTGSHHPGFGNNQPQSVDGSDDLDEDDAMTFGQQRPAQRRSGLSIHRDNTGPDITFDRPASMNTLTSGFPKPFPGSRANGRAINAGVGRPNSQLRDDGYFQYPAQQVNRNQPRPFAPGFRASDTNSHPHRDLSAFGGLTNQSVFQTSHNDYSAGQVGSSGFPPLPHLFAPNNFPSAAAPSFIQDNSLQMQNWDVFGLNNDAGFGPLELNFNTTNDTVGANPLFIEGDADLPEDDDEGTISAPLSDSSPS